MFEYIEPIDIQWVRSEFGLESGGRKSLSLGMACPMIRNCSVSSVIVEITSLSSRRLLYQPCTSMYPLWLVSRQRRSGNSHPLTRVWWDNPGASEYEWLALFLPVSGQRRGRARVILTGNHFIYSPHIDSYHIQRSCCREAVQKFQRDRLSFPPNEWSASVLRSQPQRPRFYGEIGTFFLLSKTCKLWLSTSHSGTYYRIGSKSSGQHLLHYALHISNAFKSTRNAFTRFVIGVELPIQCFHCFCPRGTYRAFVGAGLDASWSS